MKSVLRIVLPNVIAPASRTVAASAAKLQPLSTATLEAELKAGWRWTTILNITSRPWEWADDALTMRADVTTLQFSEEAAAPYVDFAKARRQRAAEASWRWHLIRYTLGLVLLKAQELRGGTKESQKRKLALLMPGARFVYESFDRNSRRRLRMLTRIPHSLYVAELNMALGEGECLSNNHFVKMAYKLKADATAQHYQEVGRAGETEIKDDRKVLGLAGMERWMLLRNCRFQDLDKVLAQERRKNPDREKLIPLLGFPKFDAIVTDPPYDRHAVEENLFADLAKFANKHLKPRAPLVVMVGQYWLYNAPENSKAKSILEQIRSNGFWLRWSMAVTYSEGESDVKERRIHARWKHLLVFHRLEEYKQNPHFSDISIDLVKAGPQPKDKDYFHEWQQEVTTFRDILKLVAKPKSLVGDPCAGWATTALAAYDETMRFIGCEMKPERYQAGKGLCIEAWRNRQASKGRLAKTNRKPLATELLTPVKPADRTQV